MASREEREATITGQGAIDNAPSGSKAYLRLLPGLKPFSPEKNRTYRLVFIPWKAGKGNTTGKPGSWVWNRFISVHRDIGPGGEHFLCALKAAGKPCPVCEEFGRLRQQGKDWEKVLKPLRPKDRELFFIHDTAIPNSLFVWDESIHLFGDAFRNKYKKRSEWMSFPDPKKGCIIEIEAKEKKMGATSFTDCTLGIEIEPRTEPLSKKVLEAMSKYCIDDCVVMPDYAKLKKMIAQTGGSKDEEEEEEEEEEPEDEEEEEEEEPEEEEEGEEEEEEEDEEEEEEPEEEEEGDEEDEEEEEESSEDEDEGEEEDEEEEEEEEEEPEEDEEPPARPTKKKPAAKKTPPKKTPPKKGGKKK